MQESTYSQILSTHISLISNISKAIWANAIDIFEPEDVENIPAELAFRYSIYHYAVMDILQRSNLEKVVRQFFIFHVENLPVYQEYSLDLGEAQRKQMRQFVDTVIEMMYVNGYNPESLDGAREILSLKPKIIGNRSFETYTPGNFECQYYLKNVRMIRECISEQILNAARATDRGIQFENAQPQYIQSQYLQPPKTSNYSYSQKPWIRFASIIGSVILTYLLFIVVPILISGTSTSNEPKVAAPQTVQTAPAAPKPTAPKSTEPKPQARPASGSVALNTAAGEKAVAKITVHAANKNCVVRLKTIAGTTVLSFFVRANETATVWVPPRTLYAYFAQGDSWYGWKQLFANDATYSKDPTPTDFSNYSIEYTLYTVPNGNLTMTTIDEDDF